MREAMTKPSLADFAVTTLDGQPLNLADLTGRVLLIVNTASECGFTPQYAGLQALHERYGAQGLTVLGSPPTSSARRSRAMQGRSAPFASATTASAFR